ncbi:hypothetical protein MY4824_003700 [Beauveria thailandica]
MWKVAPIQWRSTTTGKHKAKRAKPSNTVEDAQLGGHSFHQAQDVNLHIAHEPAAVKDPRQGGGFDRHRVATAAVVDQTRWNMFGLGGSCQPPEFNSAFAHAQAGRSRSSSYGPRLQLNRP